jgi:hypothetical protein
LCGLWRIGFRAASCDRIHGFRKSSGSLAIFAAIRRACHRLIGSAFVTTVVYRQQEIQYDHERKESEKLKCPYYFWISLGGSLPRTIHRVL